MGIKERKEKEKSELREKILNTAADLVISEGIDKCTIRNIASRIEYSPRTVYLYFRDKDHLLREIVEQGFKHTVKQMEKRKKESNFSNPCRFIKEQLKNNVSTALNSPNFYKAVVYLLYFKNYPAGPNQQKVMSGVREDLKKCCQEAGLNVEDIQLKSNLLFAFLRGFNLSLANSDLHTGDPQTEKYLTAGIDAILEGIMKFPNKRVNETIS